jgi:hypothetical protein
LFHKFYKRTRRNHENENIRIKYKKKKENRRKMKRTSTTLMCLFMLSALLGIGMLAAQTHPVNASPTLLCAMKTTINGYFGYIPATSPTPTHIEVEMVTTNPFLVGDQSGGAVPSAYSSVLHHWPDGKVDMLDVALIASCFGATQGSSRWDYMADITATGTINLLTLGLLVTHFGHTGTYSTSGTVTVTFTPGGSYPGVTVGINNGAAAIPIPAGATSFTVSGGCALVTFWA